MPYFLTANLLSYIPSLRNSLILGNFKVLSSTISPVPAALSLAIYRGPEIILLLPTIHMHRFALYVPPDLFLGASSIIFSGRAHLSVHPAMGKLFAPTYAEHGRLMGASSGSPCSRSAALWGVHGGSCARNKRGNLSRGAATGCG